MAKLSVVAAGIITAANHGQAPDRRRCDTGPAPPATHTPTGDRWPSRHTMNDGRRPTLAETHGMGHLVCARD
ncbi:MAG: hypothetical protein EBR86_03100 [Planctomycetia bacterium]|nr:hypothetical protein [Planctomycetia bacterium]